MQEGKVVVWGGFTNSWGKQKRERQGERERYTQLNAEFQRIARRDKKAFLCEQCKEIEQNNRMGKKIDFFSVWEARFQQYVNWEFPDVQTGFRKDRGTRDQIANICWIIAKAREFQKLSASASLTRLKPLIVWITTNCRQFLEMGIPDHFNCLLKNLYASQEATVRARYAWTDWFQIG